LIAAQADRRRKMRPLPSLVIAIIVLSITMTTHAWRLDHSAVRAHSWRSQSRSRSVPSAACLRGGAEDSHITEQVTTPFVDEPPVWGTPKRALVLMDVFCDYHGMYLAHRAKHVYGVAIISVFSDYMKGGFERQEEGTYDENVMTMCMPSADQVDEWCQPLQGYELVAISCESDSGLVDAERLGELLKLKHHNGINEARRNKYLMLEAVGAAGLPVVQQRLCSAVEEACEFARELGMGEQAKCVVVKPIRGVASDDVFLCKDLASVQLAFKTIHGSTVFGSPREKHKTVLVQEFAVGQEFAIDIVSKDGQHKVAAIWIYDKRPANGASFVYYSTQLYDGELAPAIYDYAVKSLDALGLRWGLTHVEVIITDDGPRLVEVNCRQHNMDFAPLTMGCVGYNAWDMLLAAYLGGNAPSSYPAEYEKQRIDWDLLPDIPSTRINGAMVHLVNYAGGTLTGVNEAALMEIQNLESVLDLEVYGSFLEMGNDITPTTDIRSDAGWVQLLNPDEEAFQRDFDRIIELMPTLFQVETR
jgi:hypothetical protein